MNPRYVIFNLCAWVGLAFSSVSRGSLTLDCAPYLIEQAKFRQTHYMGPEVDKLKKLDPHLPTLVLVEGLSSGAEYPLLAKQLFHQINLIHIQTRHKMADGIRSSFVKDHYDVNLMFDDQKLEHLATLLTPFKAHGLRVAAGTEISPLVRAQLNHALGLAGGSLALAKARTNKALMAKALGDRVTTIPGQVFDKVSNVLSWMEEAQLTFPLVTKPVESAGGESVRVVRNLSQLQNAFKKTIGKWNGMGRLNTSLLVQPFFPRELYEEYVIDVVVDPKWGVVISDVLKYKKSISSEGVIHYLTTKMVKIDKASSLYGLFFEFATQVAQGLEVEEGVLHIETFVPKKPDLELEDLIFIEAGERPAGGGITRFVRQCGGYDQITLHLLSMFDPTRFEQLAALSPIAEHEGMQIDLLGPPHAGIVTHSPTDEELREKIPAFHSQHLHMEEGSWIFPSEHLLQSVGAIHVVGSAEEVEASEQATRDFEASGLYQLRAPSLKERFTQWVRLNWPR